MSRSAPSLPERVAHLAPGLALAAAVAAAAWAAQGLQQALFHKVWFESVALAILIGAGVRSVWAFDGRFRDGVHFAAKPLLEVAVVLLGAGIGFGVLASLKPALIAGIVAVVATAIPVSYALGRGLGLSRRMAVLVACGNSICGNSAIAALAPIIDAKGEDVGVTIAFTAVMGVLAVLLLPLIGVALHMSGLQYGALAGLTVYAVPQVLAATAPMGATAIQVGTVVKLCRVMTLGPVSVALSAVAARHETCAASAGSRLRQALPWFILGFAALMAARSLGILPPPVIVGAARGANLLTVVAMAALGLETDLGAVLRAGPRVASAAVLSLVFLGLISFGLIATLHLA